MASLIHRYLSLKDRFPISKRTFIDFHFHTLEANISMFTEKEKPKEKKPLYRKNRPKKKVFLRRQLYGIPIITILFALKFVIEKNPFNEKIAKSFETGVLASKWGGKYISFTTEQNKKYLLNVQFQT